MEERELKPHTLYVERSDAVNWPLSAHQGPMFVAVYGDGRYSIGVSSDCPLGAAALVLEAWLARDNERSDR